MLGSRYRFSINNSTGVTMSQVYLFVKRWKYNSSGVLVYDTMWTALNLAGTLTSGTGWTNTTAQDNSTDLWVGADVTLALTPSGSANGAVTLLLQRSAYDDSYFPSNGIGEFVMAHTFASSSAAINRDAQIGY